VDWLIEEGVALTRSERNGRYVLAPQRHISPGLDWRGRGPDLGLRKLGENLRKRGGQLILGTRARRLLMEGSRCVGVEAQGRESAKVFRAACTLLADGGFQGNPGLLKRFTCARPDRLVQRNAVTGLGEAIVMAEEVGAGLTDMSKFYGHLLTHEARDNPDLWPYPTIDTLASSAIVVDGLGHRFIDEGLGGIPLANALAQLDDPMSASAVFDEAIWQDAGSAEFIAPNPYLTKWNGRLYSASTLSELANMIGVPGPALEETIRTYNAAIEAGTSERLDPPHTLGRAFGESRRSAERFALLPIQQPPFHAVRLCAGISYTMGGIAIDGTARVLTNSGEPIPGLYAAGGCTGGIEGGPVAGYVGGYMRALCFGLIAGDAVARTIAHRDGAACIGIERLNTVLGRR
jgi:fumarate reductase flavoprotein subunit